MIFGLFPINNKKIMLECGRNRVDDNPFAIYKYIKKNNITEFNVKFLVKKGTDTSMLDKKDVCYYRTIKGLYHLATSKYWIRSQSIGGIIEKRKKQIYIQTWHGCGIGKKMGNDITGETTILEHAKPWDFLIATDEENKKIMCSSTGIDEKIAIILGGATTDFIVNHTNEDVKRIKKEVGISKTNKKIVLYAPTFRDDELGKKVSLKINSLASLKDYIFLIRLHPLMNNQIKDVKLPKNFINVCDYPDVQDLLIISDILISDYSSIFFNFAILERPMIFYTYDYDEYMSTRGFYLEYKKDVPGDIVYSEKELFELLKTKEFNSEKNKNKIKKFNERFNNYHDGHVCERIIKLLQENYFDKHIEK